MSGSPHHYPIYPYLTPVSFFWHNATFETFVANSGNSLVVKSSQLPVKTREPTFVLQIVSEFLSLFSSLEFSFIVFEWKLIWQLPWKKNQTYERERKDLKIISKLSMLRQSKRCLLLIYNITQKYNILLRIFLMKNNGIVTDQGQIRIMKS